MMRFRCYSVFLLASAASGVFAEINPKSSEPPPLDRAACQSPSTNPLAGCPQGALLVGEGAQYLSVQAAVTALPNDSSLAVILVSLGTTRTRPTSPEPALRTSWDKCKTSKIARQMQPISYGLPWLAVETMSTQVP